MCEFVALCRYAAQHQAQQITLVSDTSSFDFSWLYYYLSQFGPANCTSPSLLFGQYKPVRDISSYFAGVAGAMQARYPHRKAMRVAKLSEHDWHSFARRVRCPMYDHDPEHDAVHVALRSAWIIWRLERSQTTSAVERHIGRKLPRSAPPRLQRPRDSGSSGSDTGDTSADWFVVDDDNSDNDEHRDTCGDRGHNRIAMHLENRTASGQDSLLGLAFVIRTDLRMPNTKIAAHCAKAALAAAARLPQSISLTNVASLEQQNSLQGDDDNQSESEDSANVTLVDVLRRIDQMQRYRAPDAATLHRVRDTARQAKLNYHLLHDERSNAPTVLAVGPASAVSLRAVLHDLRKL